MMPTAPAAGSACPCHDFAADRRSGLPAPGPAVARLLVRSHAELGQDDIKPRMESVNGGPQNPWGTRSRGSVQDRQVDIYVW
jgi:hypothetical protein